MNRRSFMSSNPGEISGMLLLLILLIFPLITPFPILASDGNENPYRDTPTAAPTATPTPTPTINPWSDSFAIATDDAGDLYYVSSNGYGQFSNYRWIRRIQGSSVIRGVTIDDFDNDGDLDFITGRHFNSKLYFYFFENDGNDLFTCTKLAGKFSSWSWFSDMCSGDFNNDGLVDFIGSSSDDSLVGIFLNQGDATFSMTTSNLGGAGRGIDTADFNNDGILDLVRARCCDGMNYIYLGNGDGTFQPAVFLVDSGDDPYGVICGDFDQDGDIDIITDAGSWGDSTYMRNDGTGSFASQGSIPSLDLNNYANYDSYDYNSDGILDVVAVDYSGQHVYYIPGLGNATFGTPQQINTSGIYYPLGISAPRYGQWPNPIPFGKPRPNISPLHQTISLGDTALFDGSGSTDPGGGISQYEWFFGDGTSASGNATASHVYSTEGIYTTKLKITDTNDNIGYMASRVIIQGDLPIADAGGPYVLNESYAVGGVYTAPLDGTGSSDTEGLIDYRWETGDAFGDDWSSGMATNWTPLSGTWTVINNAYNQSNASESRARSYFSNQANLLGDYRIDVDVTINSGGGEEAIILFRGQDAGNNYELLFRGRGDDDMGIIRQINGSGTWLAEADLLTNIVVGQTYHLTLEANGTLFQAWVNGDLKLVYEGDTTFATGWVGLCSYMTNVTWDNLVVTPLTAHGSTVTHRYYAGTYDLSLTVEDAAGQTDTEATTIVCEANDPPVADPGGPYEVDENQANCGVWTVPFDGSGSSDDFGIYSYLWNFGDGTTGTGATPTHPYTTPGTYTISLTVTDHALQTHTVETSLVVGANALPNAEANGPYSADESDATGGSWTVNLTAIGSSDDVGICRYDWNFGDGTTGTGQNVTHQYTAAGSYTATVTVTDHGLQTDTDTAPVTILLNDPPVADAGPDQQFDESHAVNGRWTVSFDGTGSTDDVGIYTYSWDFGDGTTGTSATPTHVYNVVGVYTITLTVRDHGLQTDTDTMTVTILANDPPVADAGGPYAVNEEDAIDGGWLINFDGSGTADDVGIYKYVWHIGTDTFDGSYPNGDKWIMSYQVTQNDEISIPGVSSWGSRYLFSKDAYDRDEGMFIQAKVYSYSNSLFMWGFKDTTTSYSYTDMPYAIYFAYNAIQIYEDGNYRGQFNSIAYNTWYDVKIELKEPAGAQYYFRPSGETNWTLIYDSDYSSETPLTKGTTLYQGTMRLDDFEETAAGQVIEYKIYQPTTVTLTVEDNAHQVDSDTTEVGVSGGAPEANAGGPYFSHLDMPIVFDGSASSDDHGIVRYQWDFGDGSEGEGQKPIHIYTMAYPNAQWAVSATASSQYSTSGWSAMQATGEPNVITCGDFSQAWTTAASDMGEQWLELTYADVIDVGLVSIHETFNPGFVTRIDGYDDQDQAVTIWTGTDNAACPGYLNASIDPTFTTNKIRIYCNTNIPGWNEIDAVRISGSPMEQISYSVTLTVFDSGGRQNTDTTMVYLDLDPVAICVPWQFEGGQEVPHPVWFQEMKDKVTQTNPVILKGIAKGVFTPLMYTWDFGDGTSAGPFTVTDKWEIEATHQYTGVSQGQPITATLTITDAMGHSSSDSYHMRVQPRTLDVQADIAIDNGLWYLHKQQIRTLGATYGSWENNYSSPYRASSTASSIQAFEINGHREIGDLTEDPYVETVLYGMRSLFGLIAHTPIVAQTAGDPDTNGNGMGVQVMSDRPIYEGGMVMDAIAATNTPYRLVETSGSLAGRSYQEVLTDMMNMYAFGQLDTGVNRGGWRYSWNSDSDNSACQWAAIGLLGAEDYFALNIPAWVKTENQVWLNYSRNIYNGGYGYTYGGGETPALTASAMVQLAFDGITTDHAHWIAAETYISNQWASFIASDNTYGLYAFVKAMRLANPEPITILPNGVDWFNDPTQGVKRFLVYDQNSDGSWNAGNWTGGNTSLTIPWSVIMLSSSLFTLPPVAVIEADGSVVTEMYWGQGMELCLDGSASYHLDPSRQVVGFEWDMDNDGQFDDCTNASCCYTWESLGDYVIGLRITDDSSPAQQDTALCTIHIVEPPHAPFSVIGGPYTCTAGLPITLDGSDSFDIDPGDTVTEYWWDLDGQPWDFMTIRGGPESATISYTFTTPGSIQIGLKVWDNGVFNEDIKMEDSSYTTVFVQANLAPVADAGGPYVIDEGAPLHLNGSQSSDPNDDPIQYAWDLDFDGSYDDSTDVQPQYTWMDDGTYQVALKVTDTLLENTDITQVTVHDLAPLAAVTGDSPIFAGETGNYSAAGSTSYPDTIVSIEWDWDYNGSVFNPSGDTGTTQTHAWETAGMKQVAVRVTDDDGSSSIGTLPVVVDEAPTPTPTPDCLHTGDIDTNSTVTAGDAQLAFYISLGMIVPTYQERCAADCNGDDDITMEDAQWIFMAALGTGPGCVHSLSKEIPAPILRITPQNQDSNAESTRSSKDCIWTEMIQTDEMDLVEIAVMLHNPETPVTAFTFDLTYDATMLEFFSCQEGTLEPDWVMYDCHETPQDQGSNAIIKAGGFTAETGIDIHSSGSLMTLTFKVKNPTYFLTQKPAITLSNLLDDISGFDNRSEILTDL